MFAIRVDAVCFLSANFRHLWSIGSHQVVALAGRASGALLLSSLIHPHEHLAVRPEPLMRIVLKHPPR
jgi:hypothetical protein